MVNDFVTSAMSRFCPLALNVSGKRLIPSCRASMHLWGVWNVALGVGGGISVGTNSYLVSAASTSPHLHLCIFISMLQFLSYCLVLVSPPSHNGDLCLLALTCLISRKIGLPCHPMCWKPFPWGDTLAYCHLTVLVFISCPKRGSSARGAASEGEAPEASPTTARSTPTSTRREPD